MSPSSPPFPCRGGGSDLELVEAPLVFVDLFWSLHMPRGWDLHCKCEVGVCARC